MKLPIDLRRIKFDLPQYGNPMTRTWNLNNNLIGKLYHAAPLPWEMLVSWDSVKVIMGFLPYSNLLQKTLEGFVSTEPLVCLFLNTSAIENISIHCFIDKQCNNSTSSYYKINVLYSQGRDRFEQILYMHPNLCIDFWSLSHVAQPF